MFTDIFFRETMLTIFIKLRRTPASNYVNYEMIESSLQFYLFPSSCLKRFPDK